MKEASHASPFKKYNFGLCPDCGRKAVFKGITRNPESPQVFVRCRSCGVETFYDSRPDLKTI